MKDPVQHVYDELNKQGLHEARHHTAPPRRFRASEAANCVRDIWHRLSGDRPSPRDARGFIYGINGDVDHDVTRQLFNHHGAPVGGVTFGEDGEATEHLLVRKTFDVKQNHQTVKVELTSRADGTIDTPRGEALLEIKGMGFYPYEWLNKAFIKGGHDAALERVHEKHKKYLYQCTVTMALTGKKLCYLLVKDRSTGTLGMHNPDTGERTGIYIEYDEALFQEILQRFAYIQRKIGEGTPPPPEFSASSNECGWCSFRYRCHDAMARKAKGVEPAIVYPGPEFEEHVEEEA